MKSQDWTDLLSIMLLQVPDLKTSKTIANNYGTQVTNIFKTCDANLHYIGKAEGKRKDNGTAYFIDKVAIRAHYKKLKPSMTHSCERLLFKTLFWVNPDDFLFPV